MSIIYVRERDNKRVQNIIGSFDLPFSTTKDFSENKSLDGFDYVPSINLYVAKEKKFFGKNWFESHKGLQKEGERMLTNPEFVEYLKHVKINDKEVYNEITQVRSPWRAEWLDADFEVKKGVLHINYNHVLKHGILIPLNSEVLDKNTLMKDRTPGISLEDYIFNNHTSQGLPSTEVKKGNLFYRYPRSDDNSVARFYVGDGGTYLDCDGGPSGWDDNLGVRAAKQRE